MEPARFDSLTRSAANRRDLLTRLGAGGLAAGLLAAFGFRRPLEAQGACSLDLRAFVRLGPSAGVPLVPTATQAGSIEGSLELTIVGDGSIENAVFVLGDGTSLPVTGQAIGYQLAVRVALDEQRTLVLQGVAEQPLSSCQGAIDGSLIGPTEGDLGDFHAALAGGDVGNSPGAASTEASSAGAAPAPVTAPETSLPTPTPVPIPPSGCEPLGPADVCTLGSCGPYDDGCGGFVNCPTCLPTELCTDGKCCTPQSAFEFCSPGQCGVWTEPCGTGVECGDCPIGFSCVSLNCCGNPGQGCSVGSDCCSGSCSMLNGCN